jgi:hypothetical protein
MLGELSIKGAASDPGGACAGDGGFPAAESWKTSFQ